MATSIIRKIKMLIVNKNFEKEIGEVKKDRQESEKKIQRMLADLNGCSDSWFLSPKSYLDECIQDDGELNGNHKTITS